MRHTNDYEALDKAALYDALLAMRVCPRCRRDLRKVARLADVWGCSGSDGKSPRLPGDHSPETWHLPE